MFEKVSALLDCLTVSSEEFVTVDDRGVTGPRKFSVTPLVDDDNVCTSSVMADRHFGVFSKLKKCLIHADSNDENEMNNAAPVPTSPELRSIMKSICNYLDGQSQCRFIHRALEAWKGPDKLDLTSPSLDSPVPWGHVELLSPGLEISLNRHCTF
ncbi:hypothetical protein TNCV_1853881 [Trichonephila clavipes]|nr:hypothetical protein TNCV_1853881 [Trichonephila clavipes]